MSQPLIWKALDEVFSLVVRSRAGWECLHCGSIHNPSEILLEFPDGMKKSSSSLHCSHFWGKGSGSVLPRWDPRGADALCATCHPEFEKLKAPDQLYYKFKVNDLGYHVFIYLEWLSNQAAPMQPEVLRFRMVELLCELSGEWPTEWVFTKYKELGLDNGCPHIINPHGEWR